MAYTHEDALTLAYELVHYLTESTDVSFAVGVKVYPYNGYFRMGIVILKRLSTQDPEKHQALVKNLQGNAPTVHITLRDLGISIMSRLLKLRLLILLRWMIWTKQLSLTSIVGLLESTKCVAPV